MSVSSGEESNQEQTNSFPLFHYLVRELMARFAAQGACLALLDEPLQQMRIHFHLRWRTQEKVPPSPPHYVSGNLSAYPQPRLSGPLEHSPAGYVGSGAVYQAADELEDVPPALCSFLAPQNSFAAGEDLIGYVWEKRDAYIISQEDYQAFFHTNDPLPAPCDAYPAHYLAVPIQEPLSEEKLDKEPTIIGVLLLYRQAPKGPFSSQQRVDVLRFVERIALYLQNTQLQQAQRRHLSYLQQLQKISTAFPTSVKLSQLVETMFRFINEIVDSSSLVFSIYDRDLGYIYDVFAVNDGLRVDHLINQPLASTREQRPIWWNLTQKEKRILLFSPAHDPQHTQTYNELLHGVWGDQSQAGSFLLLPMKMFQRVIGSLSLASNKLHAYQPEQIHVLETMLQFVTVSVENAKLYERDRQLLVEARRRESQLAAINSALQAMSSVLDIKELLNNFIEKVAELLKVEVCIFFQPGEQNKELVAQALHAPTHIQMVDDGSGMPEEQLDSYAAKETWLEMIRLPFKDTVLEQSQDAGFFYLDAPTLEDMLSSGDEGTRIFLQEMHVERMLMIPMSYQTEFIGFLGVPTPRGRFFRPNEIGMLLAICTQAGSAIRSAQLFEERAVAYAELQRMDKLKDEFLVTASHELRTPMSAIIGYSTMLKRRSASARISPQQVLTMATKISATAQQLADLISNMTEAAQLGLLDKTDLHIEPVQVLLAADVAINMSLFNIEQKMSMDVDPSLWVMTDGPRFRQILSNLLENASKYSSPSTHIHLSSFGGTLADISENMPEEQLDHQRLAEQGQMPIVVVEVQDQGEGVLPEDQERIFEKFVRAPRSLTTAVRGSGLGLYLSRRYVEAMGGRLWLKQTTVNVGSTFCFYLPRAEAPAGA